MKRKVGFQVTIVATIIRKDGTRVELGTICRRGS